MEWYVLVEYILSHTEVEEAMSFFGKSDPEEAINLAKGRSALALDSRKMTISQFKGLRYFFAGYHSFKYKSLCEVLEA